MVLLVAGASFVNFGIVELATIAEYHYLLASSIVLDLQDVTGGYVKG